MIKIASMHIYLVNSPKWYLLQSKRATKLESWYVSAGMLALQSLIIIFVCLILYVTVNIFQSCWRRVFLCLTSTKEGILCILLMDTMQYRCRGSLD